MLLGAATNVNGAATDVALKVVLLATTKPDALVVIGGPVGFVLDVAEPPDWAVSKAVMLLTSKTKICMPWPNAELVTL